MTGRGFLELLHDKFLLIVITYKFPNFYHPLLCLAPFSPMIYLIHFIVDSRSYFSLACSFFFALSIPDHVCVCVYVRIYVGL